MECLSSFRFWPNRSRACPQLGQPRCCLAGVGSYLNRKGNGSESYGEHRFLVPVRCDLGFTNHQLSDSWEVGLRRADRWSALAYATTNGNRIKDILPGREGHVGGTAADNRLFVEAILYRFRTGIPWRDLPARFGYWKSVHQRFGRWAKSGVFERIFQLLATDADNEYMMIDATIVRAHQHSAGAQKKTATKLSVDRVAG